MHPGNLMRKSKSDSMKHVFIETCLIVTKRWALGRARSKLRKETLEQKKHWWTKMWEMMWVTWKDIDMGEKANMVEGKKTVWSSHVPQQNVNEQSSSALGYI